MNSMTKTKTKIETKNTCAAPVLAVSLRTPRIGFFDIEATNLKATFGLCLCVGFMEMNDKKVQCPSLLDFPAKHKDYTQDRELLKYVQSELSKFDMLVSYNGVMYDIPFLQTRLLKHGLPVIPPITHVDLYFLAKHKLSMHSKRLDAVAEFFNLSERKTKINFDAWMNATLGHKPAMNEVVHHCKQDVLVLREAYLKLRSLYVRHPRIHGYGPCHVCGSLDLEKRGYAVTKLRGTLQRIHCNKCGSWENRSMSKKEEEFWELKKGKDFVGLRWK